MEKLSIADKIIRFEPSARSGSPLILLNVYLDNGADIFRELKRLTSLDFSFAAIAGLDWDDEMSPWECPPLSADDSPCTGGADVYLRRLLDEIVPALLARLDSEPNYLALTGYSLAGLFAVWSTFQTERFARIASASGSFWFPNFVEYAETHPFKRKPDYVYLSLGDREAKVRNETLRSVEKNTRRLKNRFDAAGVTCDFELNAGNHFQHAQARMARAIAQLLNA